MVNVKNWDERKTVAQGCLTAAVAVLGAYFLTAVTKSLVLYAEINQDAGNYLSVVERMKEGLLLYRDIATGYPPGAFYITKWLSSNIPYPDYGFYLALTWGGIILCGLIAGLIVWREVSNAWLSALVAVLVPILSLQYEGYYFFLEPFVAVFAVSGFALAIHGRNPVHFFLSGCAVACAFLCKQYMLGILPSVCLLGWMVDRSRRYQMVVAALAGAAVTAFAIVGCVLLISRISLTEFVQSIFPRYASYVTPQPFAFWVNIIFVVPIVALAVLLLCDQKVRYNRVFIGTMVAIMGFTPQLLFRQYKHYFLLMIPFMVILWALECTLIFKPPYGTIVKRRGIRACAGVCSVALVAYSFNFSLSFTRVFNSNKPRASQIATGTRINELVPRGSRVSLLFNPAFYFLCQFLPAQDHLGYVFLDNLSGPQIAEHIVKGEYVILSPSDGLYFTPPERLLAQSGIRLFELLQRGGFKEIGTVDGDIQIWKRT